jgi:aminopeptidase YwaD
VNPAEFGLLEDINKRKSYLPVIKKRGVAANSDHYYFSENDVPAFFFYTLGGITAYHDIYDKPKTLPLTKFKEVFLLISDFIKEL